MTLSKFQCGVVGVILDIFGTKKIIVFQVHYVSFLLFHVMFSEKIWPFYFKVIHRNAKEAKRLERAFHAHLIFVVSDRLTPFALQIKKACMLAVAHLHFFEIQQEYVFQKMSVSLCLLLLNHLPLFQLLLVLPNTNTNSISSESIYNWDWNCFYS